MTKFGSNENAAGFRAARRDDSDEGFAAAKNNGAFVVHRKTSCACGGGCPSCQAKGADLPLSEPSDASEIEADRIASKVMRMPRPESQVEKAQTATASSHQGIFKSSGKSLDAASRGFFEPRFGYDFSRVRIHDDADSAAFAESIEARAYTVGSDIGFAKNEFEPHSAKGRALIAHELAHVVQQNKTVSAAQIARQKSPTTAPKTKTYTNVKGDCEPFPGGGTDCELTADGMKLTGKTTTYVDETNPCTKPCVVKHEDVHIKQYKEYCPKKKACDAEKDAGKSPSEKCKKLNEETKKWECESYKISYSCVKKRLKEAKACQSAANKDYGTRKLASEKCFLEYNCGSAVAAELTKEEAEQPKDAKKK